MPAQVKVSGTWRNALASVRAAGAWRQVPQMYVKVDGAWRALWTYWWNVGGWGGCSASCGGGIQYRSATCHRSGDNRQFADAICARFGAGAKPATSQSCNTHSCVTTLSCNNPSSCRKGSPSSECSNYWKLTQINAYNFAGYLYLNGKASGCTAKSGNSWDSLKAGTYSCNGATYAVGPYVCDASTYDTYYYIHKVYRY